MATWKNIKEFISNNYDNVTVDGKSIQLILNIDGKRTQIVFLLLNDDVTGDDWLHIVSPIGDYYEVDIEEILDFSQKATCGGIIKIDDTLYLRHSTLIQDLSTEELVKPLEYVAIAADIMEKKFVGGDEN